MAWKQVGHRCVTGRHKKNWFPSSAQAAPCNNLVAAAVGDLQVVGQRAREAAGLPGGAPRVGQGHPGRRRCALRGTEPLRDAATGCNSQEVPGSKWLVTYLADTVGVQLAREIRYLAMGSICATGALRGVSHVNDPRAVQAGFLHSCLFKQLAQHCSPVCHHIAVTHCHAARPTSSTINAALTWCFHAHTPALAARLLTESSGQMLSCCSRWLCVKPPMTVIWR
jgi:hypothetical protein